MNKCFKIAAMVLLAISLMVQCADSKKNQNQNQNTESENTQNNNTDQTQQEEQQLQARDRNCFHHRHYNFGGVCLLSSYAFLLEYANSSNEHIAPFDNFDVMERYMQYHNLEEVCPQISAQYFRDNQISAEEEMAKAINNYCMARGWSGYIRINQFNDWLKENSDWADNIELVKRMPETLNNSGYPMEGAYEQLAEYLEQNKDPNAEYDYAALICYPTTSSHHSVLLGYDQDYFIRDVNNDDRYVDISSSFDFTYGPDAPILEYDLFKIKRQPKGAKEWNGFDSEAFASSEKDDNNFLILDNPIPLKHLRVTNAPYGIDGTRAYTVLKIRSFGDPDYEIDYGNYYGNPRLGIGDQLFALGHQTYNDTYEFDLGQISDDLYIWGYQPNFNFKNFSYQ